MTGENRRANSRAELVRGDESLRAARVLIEAELFPDAESRLCYAAAKCSVCTL